MNLITTAVNLTTELPAFPANESNFFSNNLFNETINGSKALFEQHFVNNTDAGIFDNYITNNSENAFNDLIGNLSTIAYDYGKQLFTTIVDANTPTSAIPPSIVPSTEAMLHSTGNSSNSGGGSSTSSTNDSAAMQNVSLPWEHWLLSAVNSTPLSSEGEERRLGSGFELAAAVGNGRDTSTDTDSWIPHTQTFYNNFDDEELDPCHPNNSNFNCTQTDYVKYLLGPQTLPLYKVLLVSSHLISLS